MVSYIQQTGFFQTPIQKMSFIPCPFSMLFFTLNTDNHLGLPSRNIEVNPKRKLGYAEITRVKIRHADEGILCVISIFENPPFPFLFYPQTIVLTTPPLIQNRILNPIKQNDIFKITTTILQFETPYTTKWYFRTPKQ